MKQENNIATILKEQNDMVMQALGLPTIDEMIAPDWYEGIDHVATPDLRTTEELAEEQAEEEVNSKYKNDWWGIAGQKV